jgi:hypothetical protein
MRIFLKMAVACVMGAALMATSARADEPSKVTITVPVIKIDAAGGTVTVGFPRPIDQQSLTITSAAAKAAFAVVKAGDTVDILVDDNASPTSITGLSGVRRPVDAAYRWMALLFGLVVVLGLASLCAWGKPSRFLLGVDNRYSNSKCQLALWFGVVMMVYLASVVVRLWVWGSLGGVGLPEHLIELTGLSALTFGGAKAITAQKVDNATREAPAKAKEVALAVQQAAGATAVATAAAADPNTSPELRTVHAAAAGLAVVAAEKLTAAAAASAGVKQGGQPNILTDLFTNDNGQVDIGDFQMAFITLIAAVTFLMQGYNFLGDIAQGVTQLPDIDSTLLSSFGIGQGAYLVKKMASNLGEG